MDILINYFKKPQAQNIIKDNIEEYARELIRHEAATSYSQKMSEYYREGLERLKDSQKFIA